MFEGVFDAQAYSNLHPGVDSHHAWEHYQQTGHSSGALLALTNVEMVVLFMASFEELTAESNVDPRSLGPQDALSSDDDNDGDDSDDDSDDD